MIESDFLFIRARVRMAHEFDEQKYKAVVLDEEKGISSIQGKLKGKLEIQQYLFLKAKGWTIKKVKQWLKDNKIKVKGEVNDMHQEAIMEKIDARYSFKAEKPTFKEIKDDKGRVIDFQDVKIEGYANTFNLDRGGDQVVPGAFVEHLEEYLTNPILLIDHVRDTSFAAGQVQTAYEDSYGLKIIATLSNAPSEKMKDIRFKVAEGILKTFSIGGLFFGKMVNLTPDDSRFMINKIELREISIVTVPMNKESLFEVKSITKDVCSCGCDHENTDQHDQAQTEVNSLALKNKAGKEFRLTKEVK